MENERIATQLQGEIEGEVLLYSDRGIYSEEEQKLILASCAKRIQDNADYGALIYPCLPRLAALAYKNVENDDLAGCISIILDHASKLFNKPSCEIETELRNAAYWANVEHGYPWGETYMGVICERVHNIERIRSALDDNTAFDKFNSDIGFLITTNLIFGRNPNFYHLEDMEQLERIASYKDRKSFANNREYMNYRRCARITMNQIDLYKRRKKKLQKNKG